MLLSFDLFSSSLSNSFHSGEHDYTAVSAGGLVAAQESIVRLTFNDPSSFDVIRAHASELAMVFVEGVPSCAQRSALRRAIASSVMCARNRTCRTTSVAQ